VNKSLVQADVLASDDRRYRLLEPIREYALTQLAEHGEEDATRQRHAGYYLDMAERSEEWAPWGPGEAAWVRRLEVEYENFLAALRWAVERGDGELSLRLVGALADYWAWCSYLREGRRWLEKARSLGAEASPLLRAKALASEGTLAMAQGDYLPARTLLQDALGIAEALRDEPLTARVLSGLGRVAVLQEDATEARGLLERSVALGREAQDPAGLAFALIQLAQTFELLEDHERADATFAEGLDFARSSGSARLMVVALINLAQLKLKRRDDTGASGVASEALRLARAMGSRRDITYLVMIAALVSGHRGDVERAVRLLAAVDAWSDWTGKIVSLTYHDPAAFAALHARARRQLGDAAYRAVVAESQAMSVDQAADLAQGCLEPSAAHGSDAAASAGTPRPRLLLSDREQAILRLVSEGLPNKQIATALSIAERTVKTHLTSAMNKLGADNRAQAAVAAVQRGLL